MKKCIEDSSVGDIDLEAQGKALGACSRAGQQWAPKSVCGWYRVGKMMRLWKQRVTDAYPRCGQREEDYTYFGIYGRRCSDRMGGSFY